MVVANHGWQSESTDRPKGGCVLGIVALVAVATPPHLLDVLWCGAVVVVVVL